MLKASCAGTCILFCSTKSKKRRALIQNLGFLEEKDISLIISDKYKLSNFQVTKETFESEEKIEEIINNSKKINIYNNIVKKIGYDNLKFIIKYREIEKKEQS